MEARLSCLICKGRQMALAQCRCNNIQIITFGSGEMKQMNIEKSQLLWLDTSQENEAFLLPTFTRELGCCNGPQSQTTEPAHIQGPVKCQHLDLGLNAH